MAHYRRDSDTISGITLRTAMALFGVAMLMTICAAPAARAQTLNVLHTFTGGIDGGTPYSGLTMDAAGNLYGVTNGGGIQNYGVVFKMTATSSGWRFSTLYHFHGGSDGAYPGASPIFGPDGALYGTTGGGGGSANCSGGCGTVYRLTPPLSACKTALCEWSETVIYRAAQNYGYGVVGQVVFDGSRDMYGAVAGGGANNGGFVFELSPHGGGWTSQLIYSFDPNDDGCNDPEAGLVFDSAGNLYGTANTGCGLSGGVYELSPSANGWTETVVRYFNDLTDGSGSEAPLIADGHGGFYGTTFDLGPNNGGTVFQLTPSDQGWQFSIVWAFNEFDDNGHVLLDPVTLDAAGNLYGTTFECGGGDGAIFKLSPSSNGWTETVLYRFTGGDDGGVPWSSAIMDAQGNLYGTTSRGGGPQQDGVVWQLTP